MGNEPSDKYTLLAEVFQSSTTSDYFKLFFVAKLSLRRKRLHKKETWIYYYFLYLCYGVSF